MTRTSLGIEISDSHLAAVIVAQKGKSQRLAWCRRVPLASPADLALQLQALLGQAGWREGPCVCGLPLGALSVRNLLLPFREEKKIAQTLSFELEEQLIVSVDSLIADFFQVTAGEEGSQIIAFAAEQAAISDLLSGLQPLSLDPEIVTPAIIPLVEEVISREAEASSLLVLHADLSSISMGLVARGRAVFFRRLSAPEQMILHPPFSATDGEVRVEDPHTGQQCLRLLCASIRQSLDFFSLEHKLGDPPAKVVLTGPLAQLELVLQTVESSLLLPVEKVDLLHRAGMEVPVELAAAWQAQGYDGALALSLQGFRKKATINFRREGFARQRKLFANRRQMVATSGAAALVAMIFLAWVGLDYRQLQSRDRELRDQMLAVYTQTFPKVTKVRDPLVEMRSALKAVGISETATPLHAQEKRVLSLLADISARIPDKVNLQVSRLVIDQGTVQIKGVTETFNTVDTIKSSLSASKKYREVQIVSATADKDKDKGIIRFEIQLQLQGV